ncbi:Sensor histidine kinase [Minicystis rosea]|nr:Sensor histidine kinase [Minicystis rosea]
MPTGPAAAGHDVQLYASSDALVPIVGSYLAQGLLYGEGAVVIATRDHWTAVRRHLDAAGAQLDVATREGRVVILDAEQTLSWLLVNGTPSPRAFHNIVSATFNMIADRFDRAPVRAYGEMVDLLWAEGRLDDALVLERLWNGFLADRPVPLLCAYRMQSRPSDAALAAICAAHAHVSPLPAEPSVARSLSI